MSAAQRGRGGLQPGAPLGLHPPAWFLAAVLAMFCIEWLAPPPWLPVPAATAAGLTLLGAGIGLLCWAAWQFFRYRTPIVPFRRPETLIQTGPYRFSRNPIYLAQGLLLFALALLLGPGFSMVIIPGFAMVMDALFVRPEERMMLEIFGARYAGYMQRVRRWV